MSGQGRDKSPFSSSAASDSVDLGGRGKSSSSTGASKSSPGKKFLKFTSKIKGSSSKTDLSESSPQPLRPGEHRELSPRSPTERSPEPDRPTSPENFFSFSTTEDVNIWGDDITSLLKRSTLRKLSLVNEDKNVATPLQEDSTVQNIGEAFVGDDVAVEGGKKPKFIKPEVVPAVGVLRRRETSPPYYYDYMQKKMVKSSSSSEIPAQHQRPRLKTEVDYPHSPMNSLPVGRPLSLHESSLDKVVQLEKEVEKLKAARWHPPSIRETIDRILVGRSYCLEWFKAHSEKVALLDAAIATNDGNCIMAVLLFLRKSVSQPILLGLLNKRKVALRHYASFLKQLGGTTELMNLYKRLGEDERLANIKIQHCESEMNPVERYNKIKSCHVLFKSSPELSQDARQIEDYARLTHQQRMIEESEGRGGAPVPTVLFRSMVTTLLYCCRFHRHKPDASTASPVALRREFNINEKQYFQMYLLALCIDDDWDAIEALVTTKGFFSKKKKSPIGFERVVKTIARKSLKPPPHILTKYLAEVDDLELRLQLATEVGVYHVGVECLKQLKDKERMRGYINLIPVNKQWEYREKIESLLSNSHIKWK